MGEAHMAALEPVRAGLLAAGRRAPFFDPEDGGAGARLLLLMETPGPAADGPRIVSQDNRTPTGANLRRFLLAAGVARRDLLIWNVVPWIVHAPGARNRAVTRAERAEGAAMLPDLLARLPRLAVAVLAGRHAAAAAPEIRAARPDLAVLAMPHPSPVICCTDPVFPARITAALATAAALLSKDAGLAAQGGRADRTPAMGRGVVNYALPYDETRAGIGELRDPDQADG